MKNIYAFATALLLSVILLFSQTDALDEGIKFLKLGNTYRESGDMAKSQEYLNKGISIVKNHMDSWKGKYWNAAAMEYYGYFLRDNGDSEQARKYLQEALSSYEKIVEQEDGSPAAVRKVLGNMQKITRTNSIKSEYSFSGGAILNFDNLKAQEVNSKICQAKSIKNLSAANCKLPEFPSCLLNFKNELNYLNLPNNKISTLPYFIDELTSLEYLDISDNKLKTISSEKLCNLKNLKFLNISNNKIPFTEVANLIRCLPNTQIIFDKYEKVEEEEGEY